MKKYSDTTLILCIVLFILLVDKHPLFCSLILIVFTITFTVSTVLHLEDKVRKINNELWERGE